MAHHPPHRRTGHPRNSKQHKNHRKQTSVDCPHLRPLPPLSVVEIQSIVLADMNHLRCLLLALLVASTTSRPFGRIGVGLAKNQPGRTSAPTSLAKQKVLKRQPTDDSSKKHILRGGAESARGGSSVALKTMTSGQMNMFKYVPPRDVDMLTFMSNHLNQSQLELQ